jgi:hypothetical protein
MNLTALQLAVEAAANNDPEVASRVMVIYLAPGNQGLYLYRVNVGSHLIGGPDDKEGFAASLQGAVAKLWPEASKRTRQYLSIAADMLARSPIAKMLTSSSSDEDDE